MDLTCEAIEILKANPYVANVTEKTVRFTAEFKTVVLGEIQSRHGGPVGIGAAWH
jgi:hypothetical protein